MEVIETKTGTFSMLEKNILFIVMKENVVVDIPESDENYEAAMQLTKGNRYGVLVDARHYVNLTNEAREYSSNPRFQTHVIAQAVIISSLASRLLANFLIQFHARNKNAEMRLFNEYDAALKWVKEKIAAEQQNNSKQKQTKKIPFFASV
jgi:hypothetical protein